MKIFTHDTFGESYRSSFETAGVKSAVKTAASVAAMAAGAAYYALKAADAAARSLEPVHLARESGIKATLKLEGSYGAYVKEATGVAKAKAKEFLD